VSGALARKVTPGARRRGPSFGWRAGLVAVSLVCAVAGVLGPATAEAGRASSPPPVPACFKAAGPCEGIFLKSAGAPLTKETGGKNGVFTMSATPLQFTKPVACGDLGCIYNHLNWSVGGAAKVVAGCDVNNATCKVRVLPGFKSWTPVVAVQNDFPVAIYLLWGSGTSQAAELAVDVVAGPTDLPLGESRVVTVRVSARNGAVNSISLGKGLVSSSEAAQVSSKPSGLSGFSLAKGGSRTFDFRVKGTKSGTATLSAAATGKGARSSLHGSDGATLRVKGSG